MYHLTLQSYTNSFSYEDRQYSKSRGKVECKIQCSLILISDIKVILSGDPKMLESKSR